MFVNRTRAVLMIYGHGYPLCWDLFSVIRPECISIRNLVLKVPWISGFCRSIPILRWAIFFLFVKEAIQINRKWCTIGIFMKLSLHCWVSSVEGGLRQRLACSEFTKGAWCGVGMGSRFWWVGGLQEIKIITKERRMGRGVKEKAMVQSFGKQME